MGNALTHSTVAIGAIHRKSNARGKSHAQSAGLRATGINAAMPLEIGR